MERNKAHIKKHTIERKYNTFELEKMQRENPKRIFSQKPYASRADIKLREELGE